MWRIEQFAEGHATRSKTPGLTMDICVVINNPRRWAIAVAVAAVAVLALAACGGPGVEVVATATPDPFASDRIRCTPEVVADRDWHIDVLIEVWHAYKDDLKVNTGVIGAGVGNTREADGREGVPAIIVVVHAVLEPGEVDPRTLLPTVLQGCEVAVTQSDIERDTRSTCEFGATHQLLVDVRERHRESIRAYPGVVGAGQGLTPDAFRGEFEEGHMGLIFNVRMEFVNELFDARDLVPKTVEGCTVFPQLMYMGIST